MRPFDRRRGVALALVGALRLAAPGLGRPAPAIGAGQRPNIVLILTDDLDGRAMRFLPNAGSLLQQQGITFPNAFVTSPNCCPSRSSTLRGQYAHNHGVLRNSGGDGGFATFHDLGRERSTIGTWLQQAGYRTGLIGKYLNGYPKGADRGFVPPGWNEWVASEELGYFDYDLVENGEVVHFGKDPEDYLTDVLSTRATNFIARSVNESRPFFLYLAPRAPHGPETPAPRDKDAFAGATAPRLPSFDEQDVSDKPTWVRDAPRLGDRDVARIDEEYRRRLETMLAVDDMVAAIVQALAESGALDTTYLFFASDNGFQLGEHRQPSRKGTPYDEVVRIPLIVRGPGIAAGSTSDALVANTDLAPTFADLAGARTPNFVDGRSIVPLLRGGAGNRRAILVEDFGGDHAVAKFADPEDADPGHAVPPFRALRTADLLYVEYASGERELYDRRDDPNELENIVSRTANGVIKELSARLETLSTCGGARCRKAEDRSLPVLSGREQPRAADERTLLPSAGRIVKPDADASVSAAEPDRSFGRTAKLAVSGGDRPSESYLHFSVRNVKGTIERATLRLFVATTGAGSQDGPTVFLASSHWNEREITWNNRPDRVGDRLDNPQRLPAGEWARFDVSAAVTDNGVYTFVLTTDAADAADGVVFASRQSETPPELVVETANSLRNAAARPPKPRKPGRPARDRSKHGKHKSAAQRDRLAAADQSTDPGTTTGAPA